MLASPQVAGSRGRPAARVQPCSVTTGVLPRATVFLARNRLSHARRARGSLLRPCFAPRGDRCCLLASRRGPSRRWISSRPV